jgi:hypothetical protein
MVTFTQVTRLEARIAALADEMNPSSGIRYEVELIWLQQDGSMPDRDDNPVARGCPSRLCLVARISAGWSVCINYL